MKKCLLCVFLLTLLCISAKSEPGASAYEGTRFLVGFMQNENLSYLNDPLYLRLYITAKETTAIRVSIPYNTPFNYLLEADSVLVVDVDPSMQMMYSEVPLRQAIEIISDLPVTVSGYSSRYTTTDSYLALPVSSWGKEYVVLSYPNDQYAHIDGVSPQDSSQLAEPRSSEFMVIANEDSTVITFQPKSLTWNAKQVYKSYSALLNRNECYLVKSAQTAKGTGDLTGTIVYSNKPIGFISGHVRTAIPQFLNSVWTSKNHLIEMLQPVSSWGRKFITMPIFQPAFTTHGDLFRVTSFYPNTYVSMKTPTTYHSYFMKDPGSFLNIQYQNENAIWTSDKPVQIGQYMMRSGNSSDNTTYDPSMVTIPPVEQFVNRAVFYVPANPNSTLFQNQFQYHHIMLIAEDSCINTLNLDGKYFTSNWPEISTQYIFGTKYHWARVYVKPGTHQLKCDNGKFLAILCGYGFKDAYSQVVGSLLANPFVEDSVPPEVSLKLECGKLDGYAFEKAVGYASGIDYIQVIEDSTYNFKWTISPKTDTTTFITIHAEPKDASADGRIILEVRDKNGNGGRYRFYYNKILLKFPAPFNFGSVHSHDTACFDFKVINYGKDTILINDSYLIKNDLRLRYILDKPLPYKLKMNDTIYGKICFDPRGDTNSVSNQLVFVYGCNLDSRINITADVQKFDLEAYGYNFGLVRIGDTACAKAYLINPGKFPITVDSLVFPVNSVFIIDTVGLFPKTLQPGDTLWIEVCFLPDSNLNYSIDALCINNEKIPEKLTLSGRGGNPLFNSLVIDWGNRRVGIINDSNAIIINEGNYNGIVTFNEILGDSSSFIFNQISSMSHDFKPGDTLGFNIGFTPSKIGNLVVDSYLNVDWKFHPELIVTLKGFGTLPAIQTTDIDFGKIHIFDTKDSDCSIVKSSGNEVLTIDSIIPVSGDISSFLVDFTSNLDTKLQIDSFLIKNIKFNPQKVGSHSALYKVIHDANPGYSRSESFFTLKGIALPYDTLLYNQSITGTDLLNVCNEDTLNYKITNLGNFDLAIKSLNITSTNIKADWVSAPSLPFNLIVDSTYSNKIIISNGIPVDASVKVTAVIFDTITSTANHNLKLNKTEIIISALPGFKASPGDTAVLKISGIFPYKISQSIGLRIVLMNNVHNYKPTSDNAILTLSKGNFSEQILCNISVFADSIVFIPISKMIIPVDSLLWQMEVPLFVYLNDEKYPQLGLKVYSDDCYNENQSKINTEITEVCVFNIRSIVLNQNLLKAELMPNPANDQIELKIEIEKDLDLKINIFDFSGKKSYFSEKLNLKKGIYSRIFETRPFTNGMYFMNLESSHLTKNLIFIIKK